MQDESSPPRSPFPMLAEPISLGSIRLNNRILMGSMHTGLEEGCGGKEKLAAFYAERVLGGTELIVTGGISPNFRGRLALRTSQLSNRFQLGRHRHVCDVVHAAGGHICLQVLHAGRYAMHPFAVAPSAIKAPISPITPRALSARAVEATIDDFVNTAVLAHKAGYDGIEVMGSEGYLINQFTCPRTNQRNDSWGGDIEGRMRFPVEIVRRIRETLGKEFLLIYRLSMLDLVDDGNNFDEVVTIAQAIEAAGADVINTGIGWHEVRIPTIASSVPRAAFGWVTKQLKQHVDIPLIACNRINDPVIAEQLLDDGVADMVSMARPLLADPEFVNKSLKGEPEKINTCIACNQGCLDKVFSGERATCMVNPRACYETSLMKKPAVQARKIIVIGLGPAGLSCAVTAAQRGHDVIAYDAGDIGGQFRLAMQIPGKEEYAETIRYFRQAMLQYDVDVRTNTAFNDEDVADCEADAVVLATGVVPRVPQIPGIEHPCVISYESYISGDVEVGEKIAIIGAGGIGFDVADKLTHDSIDAVDWQQWWGVDTSYSGRGGVRKPLQPELRRHITMLQRKHSKPGKSLGKSTGWIHRLDLRKAGIEIKTGVSYTQIDDAGLHYEQDGNAHLLQVDHIILCAGQESNRELLFTLQQHGLETHVIGGAYKAAELDAVAAIRQGTELGLVL